MQNVSGIGDRIKLAREHAGISQSDLAERVTGSRRAATVSDWETGETTPAGDQLMRLPGALGVDGHWLLTGTGGMERVEESEAVRRLALVRHALDAPIEHVEVARGFSAADAEGPTGPADDASS